MRAHRRRGPSAKPRRGPREKPNLLTFGSQISILQSCEQINYCLRAHSVVFCYGGPSKHTQGHKGAEGRNAEFACLGKIGGHRALLVTPTR